MLVGGIFLSIIWTYPLLTVVWTIGRLSGSVSVRVCVRVCDVVIGERQGYEMEPPSSGAQRNQSQHLRAYFSAFLRSLCV